jgi:hypothetical protein
MNNFLHSALSKKNLLISLLITSTVLLMGLTRWRTKRELIRRKKKKKEGSVNIGGIFGMDIGGTLSKIVYFERKSTDPLDTPAVPSSSSIAASRAPVGDGAGREEGGGVNFDHLDTPAHQQALEEFHLAMKSETMINGSTGSRDNALSFYSNILGGRLHFLRFETRRMETTVQTLSATDITDNIKSIGCTGGGAHKYQHIIHDSLDIHVVTFDELQCLIRGMQFVLMNYSNECYTYRCLPSHPLPPLLILPRSVPNLPALGTMRMPKIRSGSGRGMRRNMCARSRSHTRSCANLPSPTSW